MLANPLAGADVPANAQQRYPSGQNDYNRYENPIWL
jgi:hypothetical protein